MNLGNALNTDAIHDLQRIYFEEFGESLSEDQARELGARLLHIFDILARSIPSADQDL